jgi:penicillin amidase/acyl-homoserine-lactone acylase
VLPAVVVVLVLLACGGVSAPPEPAPEYDVRILRDSWGVPHIFGTTDPDVAYGLAYAHAEDDFATIQDALLAARGRLATVYGRPAAENDYLVQLLRVWDTVEVGYERDLSPEFRAICEAYADGLGHYAALHPDEVLPGAAPFQGRDIVAGFVYGVPRFFNLFQVVGELMAPERVREVSEKTPARAAEPVSAPDSPLGSNAFAVGPDRSADGATRLCANSHQPWAGPVTWYEVHLHSDQGWNWIGATFPGSPIGLIGHNPSIGWAATNNHPDLVDVYLLEINPENINQYRFDGAWRELEVDTAEIKVKLFGLFSWTFKRELLWSVHGPVLRTSHGTYAIRFAGMADVRPPEQWNRMNRARSLEEWRDAMRMMALPMWNYVYADREGNIAYRYNGLLPIRAEGYDWRAYLPGNTSETLWTSYLPSERLPWIINPAAGFVQSCNSSPFETTIGPENPRPEDYSTTFGIETSMTNRALRALELYGTDESITGQEFADYKYDLAYSERSDVARMVEALLAAPPSDDPVVREAVEVLRGWDLRTDSDNTGAAIGVLGAGRLARAWRPGMDRSELEQTFATVAHRIKQAHGRIDVPWGEIQRLRRGELDLPVEGGHDVLRAVSTGEAQDGRVVGIAGDCFIMFVEWQDGRVSSRSIHQYGSATLDESSPHYADQAPLFVRHETKPVWIDEADIRANLEREYRPGEELER